MIERKEKQDDVYFLGTKESREPKITIKKVWMFAGICIAIALVVTVVMLILNKPAPEYYYEPETIPAGLPQNNPDTADPANGLVKAFIEVTEETVNDVPLYQYAPQHARMSLVLGMPDKSDSTIVFVAQAADVRADNKNIVGDFVLAGEQLARGEAKTGFCAVINGNITIGAADNTPLLQKAKETGGYFFRQYPLVKDGVVMENNPKNKSIRRALAIRNGKAVMFESRSQESFHDFAQALADIGVSDAIYLVGSIAYGWYYDREYQRHEFGIQQDNLPRNTTYIVWRQTE